LGADEISARTLTETWEMTEPGIWSGWGLLRGYQGRNIFEKGEEGIKRDMERGMAGYYYSRPSRN
jgi:hypothetical protein